MPHICKLYKVKTKLKSRFPSMHFPLYGLFVLFLLLAHIKYYRTHYYFIILEHYIVFVSNFCISVSLFIFQTLQNAKGKCQVFDGVVYYCTRLFLSYIIQSFSAKPNQSFSILHLHTKANTSSFHLDSDKSSQLPICKQTLQIIMMFPTKVFASSLLIS